jgi:hypothetical protein
MQLGDGVGHVWNGCGRSVVQLARRLLAHMLSVFERRLPLDRDMVRQRHMRVAGGDVLYGPR